MIRRVSDGRERWRHRVPRALAVSSARRLRHNVLVLHSKRATIERVQPAPQVEDVVDDPRRACLAHDALPRVLAIVLLLPTTSVHGADVRDGDRHPRRLQREALV